jgi:hypothetical protein
MSGDLRAKFISSRSLQMIYSLCERRFARYGVASGSLFERHYASARADVEMAIKHVIEALLEQHSDADIIASISEMEPNEIPLFLASLKDAYEVSTLVAFACWRLSTAGASADLLAAAAEILMRRSFRESWGGLMAIICSPSSDAGLLKRLLDWLTVNERGAYLTKLITRAPAASKDLRVRALETFDAKEVFRQI